MTRKRVAIVVAVGLAIVAAFAFPTLGHSVSPRSLAGLALRNGRPVVLLYDCPHYAIVEVTIVPASDSNALPEKFRGWTVRRPSSAPLPQFVAVLGAAPPGWTKQDTGALTTGTTGPELTGLRPGQRYRLGAYAAEDDHGGGPGFDDFQFTVDDVNSLTPGQVMVGEMKTFGKVTEAKFYANAKDGC